MTSLRIGLIGAGIIGGTHSAVLQQIRRALGDCVQLVAVADPVAERCAQFAQWYGYRQTYPSAEQLLADADIDALFICVPTRTHNELLQAAVARRLHVFCEKPLAMDLPEALAMVHAAERAGVQTQIGLVLRFSAVYTVMRSLLRDPRAGHPFAVLFRDDQCFPVRGLHDSPWRADRTQTAGGTLIEHGVHDLDILTWFFGPMARLRAWEQNRAGHHGVEDYMAVEIEFASGLRAQLVNLWHNMIQRPSNRRLEIFAETAFIASDSDMSGSITLQYGDGPEEVLPEDEVLARFLAEQPAVPDGLAPYYRVPYLVQDLAFVHALLEGRPTVPDIRTGLEAQRLAAAVYHAAHTGEEVDMQTFGLIPDAAGG
jgi:UDP-N-acetyl-2-amino-2-deoxyglucuronate dehydrogenase